MDKSIFSDRINNKDKILGKLLAQSAPRSKIIEDCPELETIARLAEGKILGQDKDPLITHLNHCPHCYDFYIHSLKVHNKYLFKKKLSDFFKIAIPIAAAASLIVYINLSIKIGLPGKTFFIDTVQVVKNIYRDGVEQYRAFHKRDRPIEKNNLDSLTAENIAMQINISDAETKHLFIKSNLIIVDKSRGISELEQKNKSAFRLGILLVDLEIVRKIENKELLGEILKQIRMILEKYGGASDLANYYASLDIELNSREIDRAAFLTESFFSKTDSNVYLKLGEWTEGARISSYLGNMTFHNINPSKPLSDKFQDMNLSGPALVSLLNIQKILSNEISSENQQKKLQDELNALILAMA